MKSKINRTGALSLYKEVYTKTLNNIENLLNTDKDNTLAKVLVEETKYLNNKKIINFVRDTEASFHTTRSQNFHDDEQSWESGRSWERTRS